jgi:hypothetical protein
MKSPAIALTIFEKRAKNAIIIKVLGLGTHLEGYYVDFLPL